MSTIKGDSIMAKIIKYKFLSCEINHGTEKNPNIEQVFLDKEIYCDIQAIFDANYPIAEKEAVGEIIVEGEFESETATTDDVLNALLGVTV
jgi:hypothetical protein